MKRAHIIASGGYFVPRTNDGPCSCECGWFGLYSGFAQHRAAMGLKVANPAHTFAARDYPGIFARKDPRRTAELDPALATRTCPNGHTGQYRTRNYDRYPECVACKRDYQRRYRERGQVVAA